MIKTHKIRLHPIKEQQVYFAKAAGTARFVWNWALAEWNRHLARSFSDAALGKLLQLLTSKVEARGGQVIKVGRFFPSTKSCHGCGWKWEEMELSDRLFLCQNPTCAYYQFAQDRDHNGGLNILFEALRLIGLIDQVVSGIGSDEDVNLAADAG